MDTKYIIIGGACIIIFFIGVGIGSKYSGNPGDDFSLNCSAGTMSIARCIDTTLKFIEIDKIDETYIRFYKAAGADSIGFSLDKGLLDSLSAYINNSTNVRGIRVYPGIDDSGAKLLILKPLNANGKEIANLGGLITTNLGPTRGPCPKWCDRITRVIKYSQ